MLPSSFLYPSFVLFIIFLIWRKFLSRKINISLDIGRITISKIQFELNIFDETPPKLCTLTLSNVNLILTSIGSLRTPSNRALAFVRSLLLSMVFRFVELRVECFCGEVSSAFFKSIANKNMLGVSVRFSEGTFFSSKALGLINGTIRLVTADIGFVTISNSTEHYWSLDTRAKLIELNHPEQSKHVLSVNSFYNLFTKDVEKLRVRLDVDRFKVNYSTTNLPTADMELYDIELVDTIDKEYLRSTRLSLSLKAARELILKCKIENMTATAKDFILRASDVQFGGDEVKIRSVYFPVKSVGVTVKHACCGIDFANNRLWWKWQDYELDNALIQGAVFVFASDMVNILRNHYITLDNDEAAVARSIRRKFKEITDQVHSLMLH